MFKKFGIGMLAVALAVAFSAFTTTPRSSSAGKSFDTIYWYKVNPATNAIDRYSDPLVEPDSEENACPEGNEVDCQRGFTMELNTQDADVATQGEFVKQREE